MKCPHDGTILVAEHYEASIEVDRCGECAGVWLDKGELEQIQETVQNDYRTELEAVPESTVAAYRNARSDKGSKNLPCPNCAGEMSRREHGYCSQIFIDVCPQCSGVWLDEGELKALEIFFERSQADTGELRVSFWQSLKELVFSGIVPHQ